MLGEPKMSLGYMRGNTWVIDTRYQAYAESELYRKLVSAAAKAGFGWKCEYSYSAKQYTAEIETLHRHAPGRYSIVSHENAFDPHPMTALTSVIRKHGTSDLLVAALCLELDVSVIREKLLPIRALETALEDLEDMMLMARLG